MSDFDWRIIPRQIQNQAKAYLLVSGIKSSEISSVANETTTNNPAWIVATAKVWELADFVLKCDKSKQVTLVHEAMYLLGRYEVVMKLFKASPGWEGEIIARQKRMSEKQYLLFARATERYLDDVANRKVDSIIGGRIGAAKSAETKRRRTEEILNKAADAYSDLSQLRGKVTLEDIGRHISRHTEIENLLSKLKKITMTKIKHHALRK